MEKDNRCICVRAYKAYGLKQRGIVGFELLLHAFEWLYSCADNELFENGCWGFVLLSLIHRFALLMIGDVFEGFLTVPPILAVRGNARDHCFRIMRLCLELVTENTA